MDKLSKVYVSISSQVKDREKSFTNDTRQVSVSEHTVFVDAFVFVITLPYQILKDIFEIRDCNILFEFLVV